MIIAIEGLDQAGKKTQTEMLVKALRRIKIKTSTFSFPDYSTVIGKEIKNYLYGKRKFTPEIIHFLYAANRHEKLDEIKKFMDENRVLQQKSKRGSNTLLSGSILSGAVFFGSAFLFQSNETLGIIGMVASAAIMGIFAASRNR